MNFIKKWATVVPLCLSLSCATVYGETPISGAYANFSIGASDNDEDGVSAVSGIDTSHMGAIYGQDKITAVELKFEYKDTKGDDSESCVWKAEYTYKSTVTYTAQVTCLYKDGLLKDYDECKITVMPPSGSCCFSAVYKTVREKLSLQIWRWDSINLHLQRLSIQGVKM